MRLVVDANGDLRGDNCLRFVMLSLLELPLLQRIVLLFVLLYLLLLLVVLLHFVKRGDQLVVPLGGHLLEAASNSFQILELWAPVDKALKCHTKLPHVARLACHFVSLGCTSVLGWYKLPLNILSCLKIGMVRITGQY